MKKNMKSICVVLSISLLLVSNVATAFHEKSTKFECSCQKNSNSKNDYELSAEYPTMNPIPIESVNLDNRFLDIEIVETPEEFSWRDYNGEDWTTPAKNQRSCGSCGIFSALGTLESIIKIREGNANINPDLSEQYVLSCLPDAALVYGEGCSGGMGYMAYKLMMESTPEGNNVNGALFESFFPYRASDDIPCSNKIVGWEEKIVPILDCGQISVGMDSQENREIIKSLILQKGPVAAYMYVPMYPNVFHNWGFANHEPTDYYPYKGLNINILNHEIMMLGWKNDPSIGNGGYWICKNSWGIEWGYDGFFNIEFGALGTAFIIDWVDYDPDSFDWPVDPHPPSLPTIQGPTNGKTRTEHEYTISCSDQDDDNVFYTIDWDDGSIQEWIGPYNSGEEITLKHSWKRIGNYIIKVKAIDIWGSQSDWISISVSMPRNKVLSSSMFLTFFEQFLILQKLLTLLIN